MNYRNLTLMDGRHLEITSPHFGLSFIDERDVFANILAVSAGYSPTRGMFYSTAIPGLTHEDGGRAQLLPSIIGLSGGQSIHPRHGYSVGSRYYKLIEAVAEITRVDEHGMGPMSHYLTSLKHTDLFATEVDGKSPSLPSAVLGLIFEQAHTVVQYPIGGILLAMFPGYIHNPKVLNIAGRLKDDKAGKVRNVEHQYGKYEGKIISAATFKTQTTQEGGKFNELGFAVTPAVLINGINVSAHLKGLAAQGSIASQNESSAFVSAMVAADLLLQMDEIMAYFRDLAPLTMSNKPEDKILAIRKAISLLTNIMFQPYMMYLKITYDLMMNPTVVKHLTAKFPRLYSGSLMHDMAEIVNGIKLSPLYAEMVSQLSSGIMTTTVGDADHLVIPEGVLGFMPFLRPMVSNQEVEGTAKSFMTVEGLGGLLQSPSDMGTREENIISFFNEARVLIATFMKSSPEVEGDIAAIENALGYVAPSPGKVVNRRSPNVIVTDGLLSSEKLTYDAVTNSMIMKPVDLLSSSPHRKLIVPNDGDMKSLEIASQFYEYAETLSSSGVREVEVAAKKPSATLMDSGIVPLMIKRHPWFERFSINASAILNGRLPMTRYLLDGDGIIITTSTFANFASDIGMDPHILAKILLEGFALAGLAGEEITAVLTEFFIKSEKSNIPDAERWGLGKLSFRYAHYFTSSRSQVYHQHSEVVLNSFVPTVQRVEYIEWSRTSSLTLPVARPVFIDRSFQSSLMSGEGVAGSACQDIISRLKL